MACEEMDLFYRYLDAIEEAKRRAQPWQCEVTVFPQNGEAGPAPSQVAAELRAEPSANAPAKPRGKARAKPSAKAASKPDASAFKCDDPE